MRDRAVVPRPRAKGTPGRAKASSQNLAPYRSSAAQRAHGLTIATILDRFSHDCFTYEANLVPLSKTGWRAEMERHRPQLLLCESAWQGNDGQWKGLFTQFATKADSPLRELLAYCKQAGIPTVFWNKEDPPNFDVFKAAAAAFDFVFTTDEGSLPRYRELLGHDRTRVLPFAAQPAIHNPIQDGSVRDGDVCFAGSWRAAKYPERGDDTQALLLAGLAHNLVIYDRYAGTKDAATFAFPPPFDAAVRGSLDYDRMLSAYRA